MRYFVAPDANGDETLWRQGEDDTQPTYLLRRCDLPERARYLFAVLVVALLATEVGA